MNKKNWSWILITIVVGFCVIFVININKVNKKNNIPKVVALLPLTGNYAQYGENDKKGILLALDQLESDSVEVEVVFVDNKGTPKEGVNALNQVLSEKPIAIIDNAISSITESIIPISLKNRIPILSTGASNPTFSGISPFFFRIWNSDTEEGAFAAKMFKEKLLFNYVNVVYLDNVYGKGLQKVFVKVFSDSNHKIANTIPVNEKTSDYKNIIFKIENKFPIYFIGYSNEIGLFAKTLRELRKENIIITTVAAEDKKVLDIAGEAANGIIYVYNANISNPTYINFKKKYSDKYNENFGILTDVGYDAMMIIGNAIKNNVKSGEEMAEYLKNMPEIEGASGNIKFDKNGDVHKTMILKQIKNYHFGDFQ